MLKQLLFGGLIGGMLASTAGAEISKEDRKRSAAMTKGTLYLRLDAPCTQGRHPYGVYQSPLVEVSPAGANTEADSGASWGWYHAQSTIWEARINDPMTVDELDWEEDEGTVDLELEGTGSADGRDTVIRFVKIHSYADFEAAFQHAFATRPLQEEHPDWPAEIKDAIAKRRLMDGMTKRQAFYIVGTPARVEKRSEGDKAIEIWTLQTQGLTFGFFGVQSGGSNAPPETLQFENGKLVHTSVATSGKGLDLDD